MCGIYGFDKTTNLTRLMDPILALRMEQRGEHSWGVTDGDYVYKEVGAISDGWLDLGLEGPTYHTRAASVGAISERNAHPFKVVGPRITVVGVHNGHLNNYNVLKTKYKRDHCEVDSEQIFEHLAHEQDVAEIDGWGAVVWYEYPNDHPEQKRRFLSRFTTDNLSLAKLKSDDGEMVYASTREAIETAVRFSGGEVAGWYKLDANVKYEIVAGELRKVGPMNWGTHPIRAAVTHSSHTAMGYGGGSQRSYRKNTCGRKTCYTQIEKSKSRYFCDKCFKAIAIEYLGEKIATALGVK